MLPIHARQRGFVLAIEDTHAAPHGDHACPHHLDDPDFAEFLDTAFDHILLRGDFDNRHFRANIDNARRVTFADQRQLIARVGIVGARRTCKSALTCATSITGISLSRFDMIL
jgi:hypothetical protein